LVAAAIKDYNLVKGEIGASAPPAADSMVRRRLYGTTPLVSETIKLHAGCRISAPQRGPKRIRRLPRPLEIAVSPDEPIAIRKTLACADLPKS
jgi:hypothetical protein